ncbi:MAG: dCMP deaminase family protein [Erysipelotrichales bacterium]|nr:dCMP deaminase family protein [Erysipelotrichales bacterium]
MEKRPDYITWEEYFMGIAQLSALRSKDPSTQVGACIANSDNKVVSIGYNGMPHGLNDDHMPWGHGEGLESKYLYVCHAEFNAILNSNISNLKDTKIYVTLFPCNECTKAIIQTGIKEVIYLSDKYADTVETMASKKMLDMAGIKYRKFEGKLVEFK